MRNASEWGTYYAKRVKSMDGHLLQSSDVGPYVGYMNSLVGLLAEACRPGSLEYVESLVKDTVITVSDPVPVPGRAAEREIATNATEVHATVERANGWLRSVRAGRVAGEALRFVSPEAVTDMMNAGSLVAAGLMLVAPREALEGLQLALRPRPFQSQKVKDLNWVMQVALRDVSGLSQIFQARQT